METRQQSEYEVSWPLARKARQVAPPCRHWSICPGKTVCELWEYMFRGELIYPMIRDLLKARFPGIKFVEYPEFGDTHGPKRREIVAGLADKLRALNGDAVISGIGA